MPGESATNLNPCPKEPELRAFAIGDLSSHRLQRIERHVDDCESCQTALQGLDAIGDVFVQELRQVSNGLNPGGGEIPDCVLASAKAGIVAATHARPSDLTFDSGRHFARMLQDGACRLGRFDLLAELGSGSFGYVFRARDVELDRIVAIKVQRSGAFASDEDVSRFLREARSSAALSHPAIVALYDTGRSEDGVCFLVTEFVEGETLEKRLANTPLDQRQSATIVSELADAVQYAHEHGIVHRDLKPSNIILDTTDRPHITDFGLAKRASVGESLMTSEGRVMGTPAYMSPEQAAGGGDSVDGRTDIYSLGVILYELLTAERPFQGSNRLLLLQVLEDEPRRPRQLERGIPKDLETICLKAMAKSPGRRYQTASQLSEDLRRFLRGDAIEARPVGFGERSWRWCRRNPVASILFTAVTVGLVVGLAYLTSLSSYFVRETALDSARMEADMLESVNAYYSDVLSRIDTNAVAVTHEYALRRNALPLPFTFTIDAGQRISQTESGLQIRLYSQFPFRANGGPKDAFQRDALRILAATTRASPSKEDREFHQFVEIDGRQFLHYARAQLMKESCVKCHNGHPQSPKKDWKENDLVGVLLVTRPLDRDVERTRSGLRSATLLMGATVVALIASAILVAVRSRSRRK